MSVDRRALGEVAAMHLSDKIRGTRWWTLADLDSTAERIRPAGLADLIRGLPGERTAGEAGPGRAGTGHP